MLHNYFSSFLDYCKNANFSVRSIESLTFRLNEFSSFSKLKCFVRIAART